MKRILYNIYYGENDPFNLFASCVHVHHVEQIDSKRGSLLLHGGADISPTIYGEAPIFANHATEALSDRDKMEVNSVIAALKIGIPIIGICRGAQLLCALDGGTLMQHINNHVHASHTIVDKLTGEDIKSNSAHHQMMIPSKKSGANILAVDTIPTTGIDANEKDVIIPEVPEVVHFPQLRAIGIQGHPEWLLNSPFNKYCAQLIDRFIL